MDDSLDPAIALPWSSAQAHARRNYSLDMEGWGVGVNAAAALTRVLSQTGDVDTTVAATIAEQKWPLPLPLPTSANVEAQTVPISHESSSVVVAAPAITPKAAGQVLANTVPRKTTLKVNQVKIQVVAGIPVEMWGNLTSLNLAHNRLGATGAQTLAEGLAKSRTLTFLDLRGNLIKDAGALAIASALVTAKSIKPLVLRSKKLEAPKSLTDAEKRQVLVERVEELKKKFRTAIRRNATDAAVEPIKKELKRTKKALTKMDAHGRQRRGPRKFKVGFEVRQECWGGDPSSNTGPAESEEQENPVEEAPAGALGIAFSLAGCQYGWDGPPLQFLGLAGNLLTDLSAKALLLSLQVQDSEQKKSLAASRKGKGGFSEYRPLFDLRENSSTLSASVELLEELGLMCRLA